jgi:hypothetical protein
VENTNFKLWYTRKERSRNGVGILIDKSLKNEVVVVRRQGDRIINDQIGFWRFGLERHQCVCPTSRFER